MHCQNQIYSKERIFRYNLQGLFAKLKIIHRLSCLGTPEQNGITERKLRHIVKISLTLLLTRPWTPAFRTILSPMLYLI